MLSIHTLLEKCSDLREELLLSKASALALARQLEEQVSLTTDVLSALSTAVDCIREENATPREHFPCLDSTSATRYAFICCFATPEVGFAHAVSIVLEMSQV